MKPDLHVAAVPHHSGQHLATRMPRLQMGKVRDGFAFPDIWVYHELIPR